MQENQLWTPVVTGLLVKEKKIFIGERIMSQNTKAWEFPGGKIEKGESPEQALIRELQEELGVKAQIDSLKFACTHKRQNAQGYLVILFYLILSWEGDIQRIQYENTRWVFPEELRHLPLLEANEKSLESLLGTLSVAIGG